MLWERTSFVATAMIRIAVALSLFVLSGCGRAKPPAPDVDSTTRLAISPTDSATVRRLCTAPDSVLAKLAPCVLRVDFVGVKKF